MSLLSPLLRHLCHFCGFPLNSEPFGWAFLRFSHNGHYWQNGHYCENPRKAHLGGSELTETSRNDINMT